MARLESTPLEDPKLIDLLILIVLNTFVDKLAEAELLLNETIEEISEVSILEIANEDFEYKLEVSADKCESDESSTNEVLSDASEVDTAKLPEADIVENAKVELEIGPEDEASCDAELEAVS